MLALKQILLLFLLFYSAMLLYMYLQQRNLIFFPTQTKHTIKDADTIDVTFHNGDAVLQGWLINHTFAKDKLVIYYGGNAEDIYWAKDQFRIYSDTATLLVNYRGYGSSTGKPGEQELFSDAIAIFDQITKKYSTKKIILMGRSLGSGVATYVAAKRDIAGVILITPFDSIESLAKDRFPFLPVSLLLRHKFVSTEYAPLISAPTLIIYGGKDQTVPPQNTIKLIEKLESETTVVFIEKAEHNNIEMFDEYNLAVLQFLQTP